MPTYQYACTEPACRHEFELVQSFTDPAATECPVCGHAVRKKFGSVGVVFKGSGFYRTDSRSETKTSNGSAKSSSTESTSGSSDSSTSTKESKKEPAKTSTASSSSSTGGGANRAAASA